MSYHMMVIGFWYNKHTYARASYERTFEPLELIHSDIAGPFPHMSMSQAKYTLTFIDEFSRIVGFTS